MSEDTSIEWTDHTFNPVRGCTMVSPGCAHCYAARESLRFPGIRGVWGDSGTRIVAVPDAWKAPVRWNHKVSSIIRHKACSTPGCGYPDGKPCIRCGLIIRRPRVFCASLADVFEDWKGDLRFPADIAPDGWVTARWDGRQMVREFEDSADAQGLPHATMDNMRTELFQLIEATPYLDWQLLTKRPENVMRMVPEHWQEKFPENVWIGTTVENQEMADKRIPQLLSIPAKVRFLSCEPLLEAVGLEQCPCGSADFLTPDQDTLECHVCGKEFGSVDRKGWGGESMMEGLHWVIAGGESGPKARPMHPDWARSLRDQCQAAGVPFFFKQWGEWAPAHFHGGPCVPGANVRSVLNLGIDGIDNASRELWPAGNCTLQLIGKKTAGRLLDGREWNEFPTTSQS